MVRRAVILAMVVIVGVSPQVLGATWNVPSGNVSQLYNAVNSCASGDVISVADGVYNLWSTGLRMDVPNVTLRGASRDGVRLVGGGMNVNGGCQEDILVEADNVTLESLTVEECYYNLIHIRGESDVDGTVIRNVKTLNAGERHIKCSRLNRSITSDNVLIENVYMLQTKPVAAPHPNVNYVGGIDAMVANNWTIRDCRAEGIIGGGGGGNAGIFLWNGVTNCTIERNVIIGCGKGIAVGNPSNPDGTWHASGGIVRNNFIVRAGGFDNIGIELCDTQNLKVYNNTVYSADAGYFRAAHIYGPYTANLDSRYNIIRGQVLLNGATWSAVGNLTGATPQPGWFADPAGGNLRLTEAATLAINHGASLAQVIADWDGLTRDAQPDIGADEFGLPAADANLDGLVDHNDLGLLAVNYRAATGASWAMGDFNFDDRVDYLDLGILAAWYRFGTTGGEVAAGGEPIPEPMSLLLLALGLPALLLRRGRRVAL